MWMLLALACDRGPQKPQTPEATVAVEPSGPVDHSTPEQRKAEAQAIVTAELAAKKLGSTLKHRVTGAMKEGGPVAAITACQADAGTLTTAAGSDQVTVGRSSTKLRNPANAGPQWVQDWLAAQGDAKAVDVQGSSEIVDGVAHVIRPIQVDPGCLVCHGSNVAPETLAAVAAAYPQDQATGYSAGELRGALWAEAKVLPSPPASP